MLLGSVRGEALSDSDHRTLCFIINTLGPLRDNPNRRNARPDVGSAASNHNIVPEPQLLIAEHPLSTRIDYPGDAAGPHYLRNEEFHVQPNQTNDGVDIWYRNRELFLTVGADELAMAAEDPRNPANNFNRIE